MKHLYVFRHAKSSWEDPGLRDIDRPLRNKGRKQTKRIIGFLSEKKVKPQLIISSPAVRAYETALILADGLKIDRKQVIIDESLYQASADDIYTCLYQLSDNVDNVAIVGHNPTVTEFINQFLEEKLDALPVSGVAAISFETHYWTQVSSCKTRLIFLTWPDELKD